jgi:hypothetical protein
VDQSRCPPYRCLTHDFPTVMVVQGGGSRDVDLGQMGLGYR